MKRLYIANTYYQVYIAIIKEMNFRKEEGFVKSDLMLTDVATEFFDLAQRVEKLDLFEKVISLHQPDHVALTDGLWNQRSNGNIAVRFLTGIRCSLMITKQIEKYADWDFSQYDRIYMFDDADPLGYYFYKHNIPYIAIEDALDLYKRDLLEGVRRAFWLRKLLFKLRLLYLPCAMGKNAVQVEVNDRTGVTCVDPKKIIEIPRQGLIDALTEQEKNQLFGVFEQENEVEHIPAEVKTVLILAQCLYPADVPTLDIQRQIYRQIVDDLKQTYDRVFIKPHPRDKLDYTQDFPDVVQLGKYYPVEILNLQTKLHFSKAVTIFSTAIDGITIADEKETYGKEFITKFIR